MIDARLIYDNRNVVSMDTVMRWRIMTDINKTKEQVLEYCKEELLNGVVEGDVSLVQKYIETNKRTGRQTVYYNFTHVVPRYPRT